MRISAEILGHPLVFETDQALFSPTHIDSGTLAMLSVAEFREGDSLLDLGCGYGVVGIAAAKLIGGENVVMSDVSQEAVALAQRNAMNNGVGNITVCRSDGFDSLPNRDFTLILSNPPYHVDFSVPKAFIEQGYRRLAVGGRMYMVTKRRDWYKNRFISVFGGVRVFEQGDYHIFMAEKLNRGDRKYKRRP